MFLSSKSFRLAATALGISASSAFATQIIWDGPIGKNHQLSTGQLWPDLVILELGVFDAGFSPNPSNTAQWADKWNAASRGAWDAQDKYFSGVANFTNNVAPFTAGSAAWVWGVSGREWILFRKTTWFWPTGSSIGGPATTWTADDAVATVVGSVVGSGAAFVLKTSSIAAEAPPLCYADWQPLVFTTAQLANAAVSGPHADADADGRKNFMEYLAGTRPTLKSAHRPLDQAELWCSGGQCFLATRLKFDPRACFTATGQISGNLQTWSDIPLTTRESGSGMRLYSGPGAITVPGREFLRVKFTP